MTSGQSQAIKALASHIDPYDPTSTDSDLVRTSQGHAIQSAETDAAAASYRHALTALIGKIESHYKTLTQAVTQWATLVRGLRDDDLAEPKAALAILDAEILRYRTDQERLAAERQRVVNAAAMEEAQRTRLAEVEAIRATAAAETDEVIKQAIDSEATILAATPVVPTLVAAGPTEIQPGTGVSVSTRWKADVIDKDALIRAVAAGEVDSDALNPSLTWLNRQATSKHERLSIPGVRPIKTSSVRGRRK